jgi:hypothetical protein
MLLGSLEMMMIVAGAPVEKAPKKRVNVGDAQRLRVDLNGS